MEAVWESSTPTGKGLNEVYYGEVVDLKDGVLITITFKDNNCRYG